MKVGAFELVEPLPRLRGADALLMLSPWIDVSRVGSSALSLLEDQFDTKELGKLRRPGLFYDFTRYRPEIRLAEDIREVEIPNTTVSYAKRRGGHDLLFMRCLEPHMLGDVYAESILRLMQKLRVKRQWTIGAMYDSVPHTRPLAVSGIASDPDMRDVLAKHNVERSVYQGPTSIHILIPNNAPQYGIQSVVLIVHLPYYAQLEEDYAGQHRLLSLLSPLLNIAMPLDEIKKRGDEQYERISAAIESDQQIKEIVEALERDYDSHSRTRRESPGPGLSPEIERFLRDINRGLY